MPRIDPLQLLITLSVLLGPEGGIKESEDVQRVVNLMIRFSKKLVSKCIYIQILLATKSHLLNDFYSHGGWDLVTGWFSDACDRENWRLLEDMLCLFKKSPVTVERLKTNHCPKQVKHLSKEAQCDVVKDLAQEVVDMWMRVIKGEPGAKEKKKSGDSEERKEDNTWKMEMRNGICVIKKVDADPSATVVKEGASSEESESDKTTQEDGDGDGGADGVVGGRGTEDGGETSGKARKTDPKNETGVMEVDNEGEKGKPDTGEEEKRVNTELPKGAESPAAKKASGTRSKKEVEKKEDESKSPRGKKREHSSSRSDSKSKRKSSDKNVEKGSDKNVEKGSDKSSSSKEKSKNSSSSKHSIKESSRRSHKDHRDRHKSRESEKQREREKEKERERKKQSERDRETLAKVQGQSFSLGKLGAIPKKKSSDSEKKTAGSPGSAVAAAGAGTAAAKKPLLPSPSDRRPPTVKTFGAKFRSTGLEDATGAPPKRKPAETVRPPPPPPQPPPPPKRALAAEPAATSASEKRSRFEQRPPVERPGGIKVIPPKPLHLQEASGFMDALNASTDVKRKTPKRTRRLSSREDSKEDKKGEKEEKKGEKEEKKGEPATKEEKKGEPVTTPTTPPAATSPVATKPLLRFYQETFQDQEEEEKEESDEDKKPEAEPEKPADAESSPKDEKEDNQPEDEEERAPTPPTIPLERPSEPAPEPEKPSSPPPPEPPQLKGVLVYHRPAGRRRQSVHWKPEKTLVEVSYFDMDENERVNVNRAKFMEMQAMEKMREREFLRRARGSRDDGMAEQMAWQMLIIVDKPPPLAVPGARSQERGIQEERERSSLPAFFNPVMLPETPTEPEPELHHERTPCKPVPLDDDQDGATVKDHSADGWPEPRPEPHIAMLPPMHGVAPPPPGQMPPLMMPPDMMPPPNSWGPGGPMQPGMQPGMDSMMPPDMMPGPMGMPGPGGFSVPPRPPMGPPGGGWGPIGPPMGPGSMMAGPGGPMQPGGPMMSGPGGMNMMSGPGPRPPYGEGGRGGWRGMEPRRPRREIPCKHHLSGYCRKGRFCQYLHIERSKATKESLHNRSPPHGHNESNRGRNDPPMGRGPPRGRSPPRSRSPPRGRSDPPRRFDRDEYV